MRMLEAITLQFAVTLQISHTRPCDVTPMSCDVNLSELCDLLLEGLDDLLQSCQLDVVVFLALSLSLLLL